MASNSMDLGEVNDMTLSESFNVAWKNYKELENVDQLSMEEIQIKIKEAVKYLEDATKMVSELSLFSLNEELDEISTKNLKYLLLPFLLAKTIDRLRTPNRIINLEIVESYLKNFLNMCKSYNITDFELPQFDDEIREKKSKPNLEDQLRDRERKIKNYKERKAQEELLNELEKQITTNSNVDEELERKYYIELLKNCINKSLDEFQTINMEKTILTEMSKNKDSTSTKIEVRPAPIKKLAKPFILTKNQLQKEVFGLGYPSYPTMTIDEFYEERLKKPGESQMDTTQSLMAKAMSGINRADEKEADNIKQENAEEIDDANELRRLREWDDWKDDHRRGFGNRHNRS